MKHDWTELAIEAAECAADYHDRGIPTADDWHEIAMRRAAIAQAVSLASIAESLAKIDERLSAVASGDLPG